ncbi:MAG: TOTE conflict system archaeo-eukaryotic primase domain-containing protein, partial [Bacteroidota bacterium]
MKSLKVKIQLIRNLYKGREDVFATRWEKGNKSGYMPAYYYDPYMYRLHKNSGGTFANYKDKTLKALTEEEIRKHLEGQQFIGIYPLLKDNTSWFLAADFDKENWEKECKAFKDLCAERGIPAYLERSRSGKGGHVWIFFEKPLPAIQTRKLFIHLLQECGAFSEFDKSSSFDRLFPNQDYLSGKGFGNLIALPFNKITLGKGNNCFIDSETFMPYEDQWQFLTNIKKLTEAKFDELYGALSDAEKTESKQSHVTHIGKLTIGLNNNLTISRNGLTIKLVNFLKDELNFANTEYFVKRQMNQNPHGTERYFNFIEEG